MQIVLHNNLFFVAHVGKGCGLYSVCVLSRVLHFSHFNPSTVFVQEALSTAILGVEKKLGGLMEKW